MKLLIDGSEYIFKTFSFKETEKLGTVLGHQLGAGDLVALIGELGTGKTCFTRGIANGLGIDKKVPVVSPSFTLINEYDGPLPLYHFDFYRIDTTTQMLGLGYEEYFFGKGITVIEWGEKVEAFLPKEHITVHFFYQDDEESREIRIKGHGKRFVPVMIRFEKFVRETCKIINNC